MLSVTSFYPQPPRLSITPAIDGNIDHHDGDEDSHNSTTGDDSEPETESDERLVKRLMMPTMIINP